MMVMPIKKVVDHRKLEDDGEGAETEEAKDGKTKEHRPVDVLKYVNINMQALVQRKVLTGFLSAIVRKMMPIVEREKLSLVTCKTS